MIGVIADDLSGAAEIGALGLRHGLRAEIVTSGEPSGEAELVCLDTDSRSRTSEQAAQLNVEAVQRLQKAGAKWIYKKVDSVLRGHVTAELEAMLGALEMKRALLIPANPSRNRIIRNGRYFVEGRPIHETEFSRDPEHPRRSAKILELLEPVPACPISVVRKRDPLPSAGIGVAEVSKAEDLDVWAGRDLRKVAYAGAAEFFGALLRARGHAMVNETLPETDTAPPRRELFVCGTTSKSARHFLRAARLHKTPVFSLPSELVWGAEFTEMAREAVARRVLSAYRESSRVILNIGLPTMRGAESARLLTRHLVQLAELVLREADVDSIFAEGGATGAALVHRMGWTRLNVLRELAPGVARLGVAGERTVLTIKPGSYAWPAEVRNGRWDGETSNIQHPTPNIQLSGP